MIPDYCRKCMERKNEMNDNFFDIMPNPTPHLNNQTVSNQGTNVVLPTPAPVVPPLMTTESTESQFVTAPGSPTILGPEYTQGYLRTLIGKKVLIDFLIGTNSTVDRSGILEEVGISYITLRETETKDLMLCDIYSIKFVTVYP